MIARNHILEIFALFLFLAVLLAAFPVAAQETEPGDACPTAGLFRASGGPENPDGHLLYCDGAAWQPILGYSSSGGQVMLGSSGLAAAPLHVWGEAIIGSQGLDCAGATEGALRYTSSSDSWEFCDGAAWTAVGGGGASAIDDLSDAAKNLMDNNLFIAHEGGSVGANDNGNTAIGISALDSLNASGGDFNTAIGFGALTANTSGDNNTASGYWTLTSNTTGSGNTASGVSALKSNTTGSFNTASGGSALYKNTAGGGNTASGFWALYSNTIGATNTASGYSALYANTTGNYNTAGGYQALLSNKAKNGSTAIGYQAMRFADNTATSSISSNTALGYEALYGSTTAANNTGTSNTALGFRTLWSNTTGSNNTAVGDLALNANTSGGWNTAVGRNALNANTSGDYNTASGHGTLTSNTTGSYNIASGYQALNANTTGIDNTAIGYQALNTNKAKNGSTAIGYQAMSYADDTATSGASYNTALGYRALRGSATAANNTGTHNTALGHEALMNATSGGRNVAVGYLAGYSLTTGSDNILIGYNADVPDPATSNFINIGDLIYASGGKVGIGTTSPQAPFDVAGEIKFSSSGLACSAATEGAQRYDTATQAIEFCDGAAWTAVGGATPAGADTQIQFNSGGAFGASANLTWNNSTRQVSVVNGADTLTIGGDRIVGSRDIMLEIGGGNDLILSENNTETGRMSGGLLGLGDFGGDTIDSSLHLQSGDIRLDGGAGNQAGCLRFDDTTDKMQFSHDCVSYTDMGGGGALALDDLSDAAKNLTNNNLFIGHDGGGFGASDLNNTAIGILALDALNNSGGVSNTAVGYDALSGNTGGDSNVAIGLNALWLNINGHSNVASGVQALNNNTSGNLNTASGRRALYRNTTGEGNTASGYEAGGNTSGGTGDMDGNSLFGYRAGYNLTGGASGAGANFNTLLGYQAGDLITTGDNNIIIGYNVDPSSATASNELNIGGVIFGSGMYTASGSIGINDTTPDVALDVAGDIEYTGILTAVSDIRFKHDIKPVENPLTKLTSLHGLSYQKSTPKGAGTHEVREYGFAAQEVREIFPELVREGNDEMGTLSVNYIGLIAPMVEALKEQQAQISTLERQNAQLLHRLEALEDGGGE